MEQEQLGLASSTLAPGDEKTGRQTLISAAATATPTRRGHAPPGRQLAARSLNLASTATPSAPAMTAKMTAKITALFRFQALLKRRRFAYPFRA